MTDENAHHLTADEIAYSVSALLRRLDRYRYLSSPVVIYRRKDGTLSDAPVYPDDGSDTVLHIWYPDAYPADGAIPQLWQQRWMDAYIREGESNDKPTEEVSEFEKMLTETARSIKG